MTHTRPKVHVVEYFPYRIENDEGERVKNPAFNEDGKRILDLKDSTNRGHASAVAYFSRAVIAKIDEIGLPFEKEPIHIVVVPSSGAGRWSPGVSAIARNLIKKHKNFIDSLQALERTNPIEKLAKGGDRAISVHLGSIDIGTQDSLQLKDRIVLLLDDVTTSGNSLTGCGRILELCGVREIYPLAIGRTNE